jgi:hypothetical protein
MKKKKGEKRDMVFGLRVVGGCAAAVTDQYFRVRHTHVHITQHHPAHTHQIV